MLYIFYIKGYINSKRTTEYCH